MGLQEAKQAVMQAATEPMKPLELINKATAVTNDEDEVRAAMWYLLDEGALELIPEFRVRRKMMKPDIIAAALADTNPCYWNHWHEDVHCFFCDKYMEHNWVDPKFHTPDCLWARARASTNQQEQRVGIREKYNESGPGAFYR